MTPLLSPPDPTCSMSENARGAKLAQKAHTGHYQQPWTPVVSRGSREVEGMSHLGQPSGGSAGAVQVVAMLGRCRVAQPSSSCQNKCLWDECWERQREDGPEVRVALDKAQGTRSCGFLSLSLLSSSRHLPPSIFHKSFLPFLPEQLSDCRWGDHQGARCSAAQLNKKGSAKCTSSSRCLLQMLWPHPSLPSARWGISSTLLPGPVY